MDAGRLDRPAADKRRAAAAVTTAAATRPRSRRHRILTIDVLDDGTRVVWRRDGGALRANVPMILRFEVQDQNGKPASDLEPYMGMAAHAEIMSSDLQVFAHIHPSGSVPMAALMMASAKSADPMAGMNMSDTNPNALSISPELSMPYGFPKPGHYRIFLQFKRADKIETAHFDTAVN